MISPGLHDIVCILSGTNPRTYDMVVDNKVICQVCRSTKGWNIVGTDIYGYTRLLAFSEYIRRYGV